MKLVIAILLITLPISVISQNLTLSGTVSDNRDYLPGAHIFISPDSIIASTDSQGHFRAEVTRGPKLLTASFVGFKQACITLNIQGDSTLKIILVEMANDLQTVTVESSRFSSEDQLADIRAGRFVVSAEELKSIPVLLGEPDPIKTAQLLPGFTRGMEGTADVFVRGGAADQNLVLLDGAPVYNASHLLGFISVFNPDAVDHISITNGSFAPRYGGRLSSVLDVTTKDEIAQSTSATAEIGLLAARLKVDQPILKDKVGIWIAGRRSYVDQVMKTFDKSLPYHFSDINTKLNVKLTDHGTLHLSHYGGQDVLDFLRDKDGDGRGMITTFNSRNSTQSLRYEHRNPKLQTGLTMFRSQYRYDVTNLYKDYRVFAKSNILDYGASIILSSDSLFRRANVSVGMDYTNHTMDPNIINSVGSISDVFQSSKIPARSVDEVAAHLQADYSLSKVFSASIGLRMSSVNTGQTIYTTPEPRLAFRFAVSDASAFKISYARMAQYLHRVTNSTVSTPIDIWTTVTDSIPPQRSHQFSAGWQKYSRGENVFFSIDAYYKPMTGLVMYEEGTNFLERNNFASRLLQGKGKAYGTEFLIRKETGRLTGWVSYTLAWSWRNFEGINDNNWFPARYDRRNVGSVVTQYKLSERLSASLVWEFISGSRFTPVVGQYVNVAPNYSGVELVPIYSGVNAMKLSDSHRMDIGLKFLNKPAARFHWSWSAGVYNVYNRATPIGVIMDFNDETKSIKYTQPGLFGLLPFVSYGCKI